MISNKHILAMLVGRHLLPLVGWWLPLVGWLVVNNLFTKQLASRNSETPKQSFYRMIGDHLLTPQTGKFHQRAIKNRGIGQGKNDWMRLLFFSLGVLVIFLVIQRDSTTSP